jgi:hypothetical protein
MVEDEEILRSLRSKIKDELVREFLNVLMKSIDDKCEQRKAVQNEIKYWLPNSKRCSLYIRPSSTRIDIYLERFSPDDIKSKSRNLVLVVKENTHNPKDQFKSVIEVDGEWLIKHHDKANDLSLFINELIDTIAGDYV